MRLALALLATVLVVGCVPRGPAGGAPAEPIFKPSPLDNDINAIFSTRGLDLGAKPETPEGRELLAILKGRAAVRAGFDQLLAKDGIAEIANAKLLSTDAGRLEGRRRLQKLSAGSAKAYLQLMEVADKVDQWSRAHGRKFSKEVWTDSVKYAEAGRAAALSALDEWLKLLDEIKPTYEPKTKRMKFKGMTKGAKFDELSNEVNGHAALWGQKDFEAEEKWAVALSSLLPAQQAP